MSLSTKKERGEIELFPAFECQRIQREEGREWSRLKGQRLMSFPLSPRPPVPIFVPMTIIFRALLNHNNDGLGNRQQQ